MINRADNTPRPRRPLPDWNVDVLDHPVVLDVPDNLPDDVPDNAGQQVHAPDNAGQQVHAPDNAGQQVHAPAATFLPGAQTDQQNGIPVPPSAADGADGLDPLLAAALAALVATRDRTRDAHQRIGDLGRAGVVALRTPAGSLEIRETLLGWILVRCWGDPDRYDLAGAARLRAWRLAAERRDCGTDSSIDFGEPAATDRIASDGGDGGPGSRRWPGTAAGPADGEGTP